MELIHGYVHGYGDGYGCGYGCGYGYGDGYGCGDGYGDGSGSGDGSGCGDGYGYGYGSGYGDGYGYGYGYGDGSGSGDGSGYGSGYGDGDGYGYDYGEINIPEGCAWTSYHYIRRQGNELILRNGVCVAAGEHLHEDDIEMCERGLHASLTPAEAGNYKPASAVLTKVLVWGRVIVGNDKLVATDRKIVEIV